MKLPFRNETRFAGWVGNDPDRRIIAGNVPVVSLRICAKEQIQGADKKWITVEEWATVVFYRHHADDVIERGVKKGMFLDIEGKRNTRKWTPADGHTRSVNEILVTSWHVVAIRASEGDDGEAPPLEAPPETSTAPDDSMRKSFKALA